MVSSDLLFCPGKILFFPIHIFQGFIITLAGNVNRLLQRRLDIIRYSLQDFLQLLRVFLRLLGDGIFKIGL